MDNFQDLPAGSEPDNELQAVEPAFTYPPKFEKEEQQQSAYTVWLRSATSLALYLVLGYYIFHSFNMLLLITAIVVFHELGHFFAMKMFRYKDLGIFFIPLLGAYVSGSKREVSQKESAVILLAGPLPGILLGVVFFLLAKNHDDLSIAGISFDTIALSLIILNLINLLPVYPLDGGQLLNRVFLNEDSWLSKLFVIASVALMVWFALFRIGPPYGLPLLIFPAMMLLRLVGDSKLNAVEKSVEQEGINLDQSYEDLSDADYWKMRAMLVTKHPSYKEVNPDPAAGYHPKEERVMAAVQSLLHRNLIQDMSLVGKLFVLLLCIAAFATPWLLNIDMSFFRRFGF